MPILWFVLGFAAGLYTEARIKEYVAQVQQNDVEKLKTAFLEFTTNRVKEAREFVDELKKEYDVTAKQTWEEIQRQAKGA